MADHDELMKPIIRVVIALFVLAIINAIITSLPGISTSIPGLPWGIPTLITAVIGTVMIVVVYQFGVAISPMLRDHYPQVPEVGTIAMNAIYLVCLAIAYSAYRGLVVRLIYGFQWIYDLAFLLVGLYFVFIIARILMNSSDKITDKILHEVKQATGEKKVCPKCGTGNPQPNKFCDKCGTRLEAAAV